MKTKDKDIWIGAEDLTGKIAMQAKTYKILFSIAFFVYLFCTCMIVFWVGVNPVVYILYPLMYLEMKLGGIPSLLEKTSYIWGYFCTIYQPDPDKLECFFHKVSVSPKLYTYMKDYFVWLLELWFRSSGLGIIGGFFSFVTVRKIFARHTKKMQEKKVTRGAEIIHYRKELPKKYLDKSNPIFISDGVFLPASDATRHILILGASGSGKSTLLHRIIHRAKEQNKKMIIVDFKGEFLQKWFSDGDIIFNPYDVRSAKWTIFNDIQKDYHLANFVNSVISAPLVDEWIRMGRTVLSAVIELCILLDLKTNKQLLDILSLGQADLFNFLDEHKRLTPTASAALANLGGPDSKQGMGVMSVVSKAIDVLKYLEDGDFSFRAWINSPKRNILFIENGIQQTPLNPIFSAAIDILADAILSKSDVQEELEMLFIIDEFGQYNRSESIIKMITLARSKGCSMILANQDLARIKSRYRDEIDTLFNSLGTLSIMRVNDAYTQNYLSKTFGRIEIEERKETRSIGPHDVRHGLSWGSTTREKPLILPVEFTSLQIGEQYVRFTDGTVYRGKFSYQKYPDVFTDDEVFLERKDIYLQPVSDTQGHPKPAGSTEKAKDRDKEEKKKLQQQEQEVEQEVEQEEEMERRIEQMEQEPEIVMEDTDIPKEEKEVGMDF